MIKKEADGYFSELIESIDQVSIIDQKNILLELKKAKSNNKKVFIIGNGKSATIAEQFVKDFIKNSKILALPITNISIFNHPKKDIDYSSIYSEHLRIYLDKDDIVIAIILDGNHPNIINALRYAKEKGAITVAIIGNEANITNKYCDYIIKVNSTNNLIREEIFLSLSNYFSRNI